MTPREAADRLFNRVMTAASQGDTTQAQTFLPMAIAAYARVDSIDADGRFHLAQLQRLNGDPAAELAQADSILEVDPNHLFGLYSAAEAYEAIGRTDEARARYRAFLDHLDAERARGLPEYADHEMLFPSMKEHAERAVE
jgi:tetratricopeptide (TPR) repeat protein